MISFLGKTHQEIFTNVTGFENLAQCYRISLCIKSMIKYNMLPNSSSPGCGDPTMCCPGPEGLVGDNTSPLASGAKKTTVRQNHTRKCC